MKRSTWDLAEILYSQLSWAVISPVAEFPGADTADAAERRRAPARSDLCHCACGGHYIWHQKVVHGIIT